MKYKATRATPNLQVCVFADFKKVYNSKDRQSLFNILEEQGLDHKTLTYQANTYRNQTQTEIHCRTFGTFRNQNRSKTGCWAVTTTVQPGTGESNERVGERA